MGKYIHYSGRNITNNVGSVMYAELVCLWILCSCSSVWTRERSSRVPAAVPAERVQALEKTRRLGFFTSCLSLVILCYQRSPTRNTGEDDGRTSTSYKRLEHRQPYESLESKNLYLASLAASRLNF